MWTETFQTLTSIHEKKGNKNKSVAVTFFLGEATHIACKKKVMHELTAWEI